MRSKLPWPIIIIIICSFIFGAAWGWKLLRDRAFEEGRLEAESRLRVLAPAGILSHEMLVEFQRREKIEVELSTETFPGSLLRRALKSAPGQYDLLLVFHHQVSALRAERKLSALFDNRVKFPTNIAPDFRKLPNDRNLMDTAPLLWGVLGLASKKELDTQKPTVAFWPSFMIGLEDPELSVNAFATKIQPMLGGFDHFEAQLKKGPGGFSEVPISPVVVSHASLAFSPYKEMNLQFAPLKSRDREAYPLWILTAVGVADGDIDRARKFVRFLLEPAQSLALVQTARVGATTLREQPGLETLPKELQASYFRTFPIDKISVERDERVRNADDVLEQMANGANLKAAPTSAHTRPIAGTQAIGPAAPVVKPAVKATARKAKPTPSRGDEEQEGSEEVAPSSAPAEAASGAAILVEPPTGEPAAEPAASTTAPSEQQPRGD
ncbi:hypothetical protein BH10BDE1_BH10BDE1_15030 [soil metagenome]